MSRQSQNVEEKFDISYKKNYINLEGKSQQFDSKKLM